MRGAVSVDSAPALAWRYRGRLALSLAAGLALTWGSAAYSGASGAALTDPEGWRNATELAAALLHPDLEPEFTARIWRLTVESVAIGALGMALALVLGIPLAIAAARLPTLVAPPRRHPALRVAGESARWLARSTLAVLRGIPEIIWAYLFVQILGLGPGPAVVAIGLSFGGIVGKLFAELLEAADPTPVRPLLAAGSGRLGVLLYGVLPQVRSQWVGYGLFRFECAIRSASILGVVGAGGLGSEISLSILYFEFDKLATALLAVLGTIAVFEAASMVLRRVRLRWPIGLLAAGAALGSSVLAIPWPDLWTTHATDQLLEFGRALLEPTLDGELPMLALEHTGETLAMAFAGTAIAAVVAFLLAPLATRPLIAGSYLQSAPRPHWTAGLGGWAVIAGTRLTFQILRSIPDLVWAMIFILWVGPGPFAGMLAITAHTLGILGRLFGEVYEEAEPRPAAALEAAGLGRLGRWAYGVLPQVSPRLAAYALFRFEVNVRAVAMVGFVGAGGIGDDIHTAISLFHTQDLALLLMVLLGTVIVVDAAGDRLRHRLLRAGT